MKSDAQLKKDVMAELEWDPAIHATQVGVSNAITLKAQAAPSNITSRIKDALTRQAEEEAKHIEVSVKGSRATLQGTVHSWSERSAAAGAVWAAPGISEVVDELRVSG